MPATTGYQAGLESDDEQISYGIESVWGTAPATTYQAIRHITHGMGGSKDRARPGESNPVLEAAQAVTTRETAGGPIQGALSFGTFDDFFSIALGNDWQALQVINGIAADVTITNISGTSATLSSSLGTKYNNISAGQWINLLGFTNPTNNGLFYVASKASGSSLTLTTLAATVTETPTGTNAKIRASTILNGAQFKSISLQRKMAAALWFRYPGVFIPGFTMGGSVGSFMNVGFTVLAQSMASATSDQSTGGVIAAPSGAVHDSVAGFGGLLFNEVPVAAGLQSFSLTVNRQNASQQYAMGSSSAAGITRGVLEASASITLYFKSFTEYARFKAETLGRYSLITKDNTGQTYVVTFRNAALMNPNIVGGGPGQPVMATFTIEGNPQATGGTIQMDRLASS